MAGVILVILLIIPGVCGQDYIELREIECDCPPPPPRNIVMSPKDVILNISPHGDVVKGSSVTFTCSSGDSNPPVHSYILFKDTVPLNTLVVPWKSLTIDGIQPSDSGGYFCQADNSFYRVNSPEVPLDVQYGPTDVILSVSPHGDIVKGRSVSFTCSSGDSKPPVQSYILFKDNTVFKKQLAPWESTTIPDIQPSDSGRYFCQADNSIDTANSPEVPLDVQYGPKDVSLSVSPPGDVVKGRSVTFTCSSGDSNPRVQRFILFKDNTVVAQRKITTISNIQPSDSGGYFCQAKNSIDTAKSPKVTLDVHYGPKDVSLSVSPPGDVVKGRSVTFTCSSGDSNPRVPSYILFKDNTEVAQSAQRKITTISNIQPSDSGGYFCQAKNSIDTAKSPKVTLDVHYPPQIPSISMDAPGGVVEGSKVTLTCSGDANPPARYTWYTYRLLNFISTGHQLVKDNVSRADSGQYTCRATNKHGNQIAPAHTLSVLYAPVDVSVEVSAPEGSSSVNLTCSGDAHPPVHNYTWYKRTGLPAGPGSLVQVVGSGRVLVLASPQPSSHTGATYFCEARNSLGGRNSTEVPLEMDDVIDVGRLILRVGIVIKVLVVLLLPLVMLWAWKQNSAMDKVEDRPHYVNVSVVGAHRQGFTYTPDSRVVEEETSV